MEPIHSKAYMVLYSVRESLKEDNKSMLGMGIIRKSKSPYASPVVIVKKKDGSNRVCVDFRNLDRLTLFDSIALENKCIVLDSFGGMTNVRRDH